MAKILPVLAVAGLLGSSPAVLQAQQPGAADDDAMTTATMDEDQGVRGDADDDAGLSGLLGLLGLFGLLGLKRRDRDPDATLSRGVSR